MRAFGSRFTSFLGRRPLAVLSIAIISAVILIAIDNSTIGASLLMGVSLMSPRDVGRVLNLSTSRVVQLEREGRLKGERDSSGRRFFLREIVEQFAAQRAAASRTAHRQVAEPQLIVARGPAEGVGKPPHSGTDGTTED